MAALTRSQEERAKLREVFQILCVVAEEPNIVPRITVIEASTIARGTQFTGYEAPNANAYNPVDRAVVPAIDYPTVVPEEEATYNGPSRTIKVVHAEGNKVSVVTLTSPGNGINASSTTKYTNPSL